VPSTTTTPAWSVHATFDRSTTASANKSQASFANAARKYTVDVDITFQKRHLDTSSLGTNIAWLALLSTFDMSVPESVEAAREAQAAWQAGHDREGGIVSKRLVHVGSRQNAVTMKYTYHSRDYNYVMLRGYLAMLDWDYIFATAKANAALASDAAAATLSSSVVPGGCACECTEDQINPPGVDASVGVVE
jgi:hypothetical protein